MSWNKWHENLLKKWAEMSKTYSIMHTIAADWHTTLEKRLGIPVVLLGALTASSIFSTSEYNVQIMAYINGSLALIVTALSGVTKFIGAGEKRSKHTSASFKYTSIAMNIDTMLSFPRLERRIRPEEFMNNIKTNILEIREHAPDIPSWVLSDYISKLDKSITNTRTQVCTTTYANIPNPTSTYIGSYGYGTASGVTMADQNSPYKTADRKVHIIDQDGKENGVIVQEQVAISMEEQGLGAAAPDNNSSHLSDFTDPEINQIMEVNNRLRGEDTDEENSIEEVDRPQI